LAGDHPMKQLIQDIAQQIRRIALAIENASGATAMRPFIQDIAQQIKNIVEQLTRLADAATAVPGGDDMTTVNVYGCNGTGTADQEIKHVLVNILLPEDWSVAYEEIIPPVEGKAIAVVAGRLGSVGKAILWVKTGTPPEPVDMCYFPENSFILPPANGLHYYKSPVGGGIGL
jgi:hypothetical protein